MIYIRQCTVFSFGSISTDISKTAHSALSKKMIRLDTFREDWTILSSKGNSLVSANIEVAHWTVRLTLSRDYKYANVQINT